MRSTRPTVRTAGEARRGRVQRHLERARARDEARRQELRRRGHDRGGGAQGISRHRRAPRAPWASSSAPWARGRHHRHRRGAAARALIDRAASSPARSARCSSTTARTPMRSSRLRGPIFEQKVVDHIVSKAKVTREEGDARGVAGAGPGRGRARSAMIMRS